MSYYRLKEENKSDLLDVLEDMKDYLEHSYCDEEIKSGIVSWDTLDLLETVANEAIKVVNTIEDNCELDPNPDLEHKKYYGVVMEWKESKDRIVTDERRKIISVFDNAEEAVEASYEYLKNSWRSPGHLRIYYAKELTTEEVADYENSLTEEDIDDD